jgi:hypothetical protein
MNGRTLTLGAAAAAVACAVLTGCGQNTTAGSAPATPPSPKPPQHGATMAPAPQVTKEAITKPVSVSGQGRTVTAQAVEGGCRIAQLTAQESASTVTLTVTVSDHRKPGVMCSDLARLAPVSTTLKAPLDGRKLVDGTTGKPLAAPQA